MKTTIVSPNARDTAKINAAVNPDTAASNTTRNVVTIFLAPSPADASRKLPGTDVRASSATDATNGIVKIPTPNPAAMRFPALFAPPTTFCTSDGLMKRSAK